MILGIASPNDTVVQLGLMEDEAIELDVAALRLAALDHPDLDLQPYLRSLDVFAERLATFGSGAASAEERAAVLARIMAAEFGFTGDRRHYDDPDNADMIRVIDRRRGLPVSLSILYVAAARRVGWQIAPLDTPGHVLVRVGAEIDPVLIDPFNDGTPVGAEQLAGLLRDRIGPPAAPGVQPLAPMANRAVLVRLLMNQARRAGAAGDTARALTLYSRMTVVAPSNGYAWWERARLQLRIGEVAQARSSLSAMLEVTRDATLRLHICSALDMLTGDHRA
jgi:regulator of sirC expression with transglutaminase-like and TPR domain